MDKLKRKSIIRDSLKSQRGAATIILSILILSIMLVIAIGMSALMLNQIRLSGQGGQSVLAFYAAEAGAERCLLEVWRDGGSDCSHSVSLDNGARYITDYQPAQSKIIVRGEFGLAQRAIEVSW